MKYLFLICTDETAQEYKRENDNIEEWVSEMGSRGVRVTGERLQAPSAAKTVKRRGGKTFVVDGPFAEAKEMIGGFDIIDCSGIEEAIEIAAKHPMSLMGQIEIRPFWNWDE